MPKVLDSLTDPGLPTLAAVLDPAELAGQLGDLLQWDTSQSIRVRVLRWKKANRCTLEIALPTARGWDELIGKVYAEDRSDVYRTMEEIRLAGFEADAEFGIPRAIAFLAPLRLLLYQKAPGSRARKVIVESQGSDRANAAERCARWLARFHARGPRSGRALDPQDQVRDLDSAWRRLVDHGAPLADKASRLFERVDAASRRLEGGDRCAGHGTYTPGQVLLAEGRTVTMDWDTYHVADPSHDVARFLVELKRMGLKYSASTRALDAPAEVFLSTYFATSRSDIRKHLGFQQAAICLERAQHDVDKHKHGWRERAEVMLNEGLEVFL